MRADDMESRERSRGTVSRRAFLRGAGLGAGLGAGAAGVAAVTSISAFPAKAAAPAGGNTVGYRETEHVRRAYELARF